MGVSERGDKEKDRGGGEKWEINSDGCVRTGR